MVDPLTTSAISWSFSAAGWLISPVLSRVLNQCLDALGIDLRPQFRSRKQALLEKVNELQTTLLPKLLILTDVAQHSPHRPSLEKWIHKLKSTFYEAEHVLGLLEYEQLEKKVNSLFPPKFNSMHKMKEKLCKISPQHNNLIESIENLEKTVNEAMEFVSLLNLQSVNNSTWEANKQYRETISTSSSTVIGRDKDREDIVKLLRESSSDSESTSNDKCYSVIGIWGMGGAGKTTLAQYVCEYEKKAKYFDLVIWVHVSEKFSVRVILKMIWESAFKEKCPNFSSLDGLQSKLGEKLKGQMFFLVLDDVWCDRGVSEEELEQLFAPLSAGKRGSKILVTTRFEEAAKTLGAMNPIELRELDEDQFFSLFMNNALGNAHITDKNLIDKLTLIGKEISAKLHRSPLAAKMVARQLHRRLETKFWSSMLNRSLLNVAMGPLLLSYQHLPSPLQRCFAFCSLFPKGYKFEQDYLINLWIAEGFIEMEDTNEHMKDIANRYILDLVSCSFFQVERYSNNWYSVHCYSMHDLIHELAQHVSQSECFKIESGEKKEIPSQTRHLYVAADMLEDYVKKICKLKDLRTIIVFSPPYTCLKEVHLDALFMNLRKLCVVELQEIEGLPKSVSRLKNLRYLRIANIRQMDAIPKSLSTLYQLRTLCIWDNHSERQIAIPDVGKLTLLQDYIEFRVQKRRGFELNQLEHLNDLFGTLAISNLCNVERKEEVQQAKLSEKKSIQNLWFCWDHEPEDVLKENDVEIIDSMCPPPNAKGLHIQGYSGKRLPNWVLENNDNIIHLECLTLFYCRGLEALQRMNELVDLQALTIYHLPRLKKWVPLPLNLIRLNLIHILSLAFALKEDLEMITPVKSTQISQILAFTDSIKFDWEFELVQEMIKLGNPIDEQALSTISNDLKSCLEKLLDLICQLKDIYGNMYLPPALNDLSIESCFVTDKVLARSLQGLNSLKYLTLNGIITITCITDEVLSSLTSLEDLYISKCLLLMSIGGWDTHSTLERLDIHCCPNLTLKASVDGNNCNIAEQTTSSCKGKTTSSKLNDVYLEACMPSDDSFQNLVSLETLQLLGCPSIENPHVGCLKSLIYLRFRVCPNLISVRGLSELNHLKRLEIFACEKLKFYSDTDKPPVLRSLSIDRLSLLEQFVSRDGFSSLVSLRLGSAEQEYFSQEECEVLCNLDSLENICFDTCKMRMLPNLLGLRALKFVNIGWCANITCLSELPPSVQNISISYCNEDFHKSCLDPRNPNWQKIAHIPKKDIQS